jgi:hypothetical protein
MKEQARMQRDMLRAQRDAYRYQMRAGRRSSILGPLLMIAIGVVFLLIQTGRISMRYFWDWYGHWWPLLLVGAGIVVLGEWAFDQFFHSDDAIPRRRSLGGGVFFLLLVFGVCGIIVSGISHNRGVWGHMNLSDDNLDEFFGDKHESEQALAQAIPAGASVLVDNPRGDVTVTGTSDDNQLHVTVNKAVYTRSDSDAEKKAQQITPNISTEGNTVSVTVPALEGGRADLTILVPPGTPTTISSNRGDIHVSDVKAPVNVTANHGDINTTAITGNVSAHVNNGDSSFSAHSITGNVTVEGHAHDLTFSDIDGPVSANGEFFGTTHLEHIRGNVLFHTSRTDLRLARLDGETEISPNADLSSDQVQGPLTLTTRNRNISLDRVSGDVSITNRNGSVDLTSAPPLGNVTVENRNGSVSLTMPEHAGFIVQAETTNGDAENDFDLNTDEHDDSNRKSINGTVGKGGPLVRITTTQGDVAIRKASVEPIPPKPPAPPAPISIHGDDGSAVVIGKEGVHISGSDGSAVIVDKSGVRINSNADGSSVYVNKGTRLTKNADGSFVYVGADGTRYSKNADGSKIYNGKDGTRIIINADGTKIATSPSGRSLSDSEINAILNRAQQQVDKAAAERDAARNK